jgi:hypothetical protein
MLRDERLEEEKRQQKRGCTVEWYSTVVFLAKEEPHSDHAQKIEEGPRQKPQHRRLALKKGWSINPWKELPKYDEDRNGHQIQDTPRQIG